MNVREGNVRCLSTLSCPDMVHRTPTAGPKSFRFDKVAVPSCAGIGALGVQRVVLLARRRQALPAWSCTDF
jgi:hypothetical protein